MLNAALVPLRDVHTRTSPHPLFILYMRIYPNKTELPLELPDGTTPRATLLCVYSEDGGVPSSTPGEHTDKGSPSIATAAAAAAAEASPSLRAAATASLTADALKSNGAEPGRLPVAGDAIVIKVLGVRELWHALCVSTFVSLVVQCPLGTAKNEFGHAGSDGGSHGNDENMLFR